MQDLNKMTWMASKCKISFKLRCDGRFQRAFIACCCIFKVITLVWANQDNFFENANTYSKRTLKTTVATQLYFTYTNNYTYTNTITDTDTYGQFLIILWAAFVILNLRFLMNSV